MLRLFCTSKQQSTVERLNDLTQHLTTYQWAYDKNEGYVLSFPDNTLSGDFLHVLIKESLKEAVPVSIKGNGFNAVNGKRLIIQSHDLSKEIADQAKLKLDKFYEGSECKRVLP